MIILKNKFSINLRLVTVLTLVIVCFFSEACVQPEFEMPQKSSFIFFTPLSKKTDTDDTRNTILVAEPKRSDGKISFNVKDMDVREFFQLLTEESGERFAIDKNLDFKVTMKVEDAELIETLQNVRKQFQLVTKINPNNDEGTLVFRYVKPPKQLNWVLIKQFCINLMFLGVFILIYIIIKRRTQPNLLRGNKEQFRDKDWWHGKR